ncbi:MAG: HAMP domain-containing protein, partial [Legionella sp.]
ESGKKTALMKLLLKIGITRHMTLYLLSSKGEIISTRKPPNEVVEVRDDLMNNQLSDGIFKSGNLIVSHEILSSSGTRYRLAAITEHPLSHFLQFPWAGLTFRLVLAVFFSGLICYLLSLYLTKPLRTLGEAAHSIAKGKFNTRVGHFRGHNKDEIAQLSDEFDQMAEQIEQLVTSKERLLQDISHELRSPLARLQIALELARNKAKHLADNELNRMEMECARLNALIGEILEFARMDKSTTELHLSEVNMLELLEEIIRDANFESGEHNYRVQLGKTTPCTLLIDERLIHRAIENILRNALHYTPENKHIVVSLELSPSNKEIYIDIKDQGPGVPEDQLEKIFTPFYRVDLSREKKTGGFGLGLAIAASAVELHQGKITAFNHPDGGLLVRITLLSMHFFASMSKNLQ